MDKYVNDLVITLCRTVDGMIGSLAPLIPKLRWVYHRLQGKPRRDKV